MKVTVYGLPGGKALLAVANWTDEPQTATLTLDVSRLGFEPVRATLPEVETLQTAGNIDLSAPVTVDGKKGLLIIVE